MKYFSGQDKNALKNEFLSHKAGVTKATTETLPSFCSVLGSFGVVLLLHVHVPPSHRDGYQGKALLQGPRVHHGFYIKAFLSPVLR